ncbi:MAG: prepilin-type N-terminal cleavage/methylation domain-containing protein [Bdellovibrionales bacterium]|nr:prepilin-type N-terminal cleavage/methylation domain-containing protein [Bdellovibrionales bacterium]
MKRNAGFTLIEILAAILIFGLSIFAVTQARTTSLRNVVESQRMFEATQLAQSKMAELELKYQKQLDKDGVAATIGNDGGTFDEPNSRFSWKAEVKESTIKFTREIIAGFMKSLGADEEVADKKADELKLVLANLNKTFKNNFVELHVDIQWKEFGKNYTLPLVTHLVPAKPKIELTTTGEE